MAVSTRLRGWIRGHPVLAFVRRNVPAPVLLLICLAGCGRTGSLPEVSVEAGPTIEFVRTPDERFEGLPDYAFEPQYAMVEGLRDGGRRGPIP